MFYTREEQFLVNDKENGAFVVILQEHYLFKWCYSKKETHIYNQRVIAEFTPSTTPKKTNPIGFKVNNTNSKKKKNENKGKAN